MRKCPIIAASLAASTCVFAADTRVAPAPTLAESWAVTPSIPAAWPVVELDRSGAQWRVSSNTANACAVPVGRTYAILEAVEKAFEVCGSIVLKPVTPGDYADPGIAMHGKSMAWVGPVDANGKPLIRLMPASQSVTAFSSGGNDTTATYWAVNFNIGPPDSLLDPSSTVAPTCALKTAVGPAYRNGLNAISFLRAGRFNGINLHMRNGCGNGILSHANEEWLTLRSGQVWIYNSEIYGYGTQADEHNVYMHDMNTFAFIRSISSDTAGGGHLIKIDGGKVIVADSALVRNLHPGYPNADSGTALLNITRTTDSRIARDLFKFNPIGNSHGAAFVSIVSRISSMEGFSLKTPPVADLENKPGFLRQMTWASGGDGASYWTGSVLTPAVSGAPNLVIGILYTDGGGGGTHVTLSTETQYTVRVQLNDGSVQEFVTTPAAASASGVTFPVPGNGLSGPAAKNNYVAVKPADRDWDHPVLNPRYANQNAPDYWWRSIKTTKGELDLAHQERFNTHYFEDDLFVYDNLRGQGNLFFVVPGTARMFWVDGPAPVPEIPLPPYNRPQGATATWPDRPGYAEWKEPLQGPGYPSRGRNPAGVVSPASPGNVTDFIWAWPLFTADIGYAALKKPLDRQFKVDGAPHLPESLGFAPDARYINAAGALIKVASINPMPVPGRAALVGAHAAGGRVLTVDSAAGCSQGQKIMVELQPMAGAAKSMEVSTVDQPVSGAAIHIADALSREAAAGASVVCFIKAGSRPATWIGPSDYAAR